MIFILSVVRHFRHVFNFVMKSTLMKVLTSSQHFKILLAFVLVLVSIHFLLKPSLSTVNTSSFVNLSLHLPFSNIRKAFASASLKQTTTEKVCSLLCSGTASSSLVRKATQFRQHILNTNSTRQDFCPYYKKRRFDDVIWRPVNEEEANFPIAFGLLVYRNFDQVEQLFRSIFRPWNFYCFHIDATAAEEFKLKVKSFFIHSFH